MKWAKARPQIRNLMQSKNHNNNNNMNNVQCISAMLWPFHLHPEVKCILTLWNLLRPFTNIIYLYNKNTNGNDIARKHLLLRYWNVCARDRVVVSSSSFFFCLFSFSSYSNFHFIFWPSAEQLSALNLHLNWTYK